MGMELISSETETPIRVSISMGSLMALVSTNGAMAAFTSEILAKA
jgi:hypothetical protein